MKNTWKLLLMAFLSITLLTGCNEDDDTPESGASLVGLWNLTSYNYSGDITTTNQGVTIETQFNGEAINIDATLEIAENPNTMTAAGTYDIVLTTIFLGDEIEQTVSIPDVSSESTWERNGNTLTIIGDVVGGSELPGGFPTDLNTQDYTIVELTDTTLRLTLNTSFEVTQVGVENSYSLTIDMVLNK